MTVYYFTIGMTSIALSFAVIATSAGECGAGPDRHVKGILDAFWVSLLRKSLLITKKKYKSYVIRGEIGLPVFKPTKKESSETRCYRQVLQGR